LAEFAGHPVIDAAMAAACQRINAGRLDNARHASHYQDQIPALVARPLMKQLGYGYALPARRPSPAAAGGTGV
jgi:hypothetical protein